jgi:hypothetical protein
MTIRNLLPAGLRVGGLKVASIDDRRMLLHIADNKRGRGRHALLSARLLEILRAYDAAPRSCASLIDGHNHPAAPA